MADTAVIETQERRSGRPGPPLDEAALASIRRSRRILVLGSSGAGKSHLSVRLAEILGIEVVHLDDHRRPSDGRPCDDREWHEIVKQLAARESWIMDGTYERSLYLRIPRADAIILLECPPELCLERVVRRDAAGAKALRDDRSSESPHAVDPNHVQYIADYASVTRPRVLADIERYGRGKTVAVVPAPEAVDRFLSALQHVSA